jgi:hypothetical protein
MARAYIKIGEINRNLILVAISWIEMPDATSAKEYKRLVDNNEGRVIELSRETRLYRNITFDDRNFMTGIKGTFVWNVEATSQFSTTPDSVTNEIVAHSRQQ